MRFRLFFSVIPLLSACAAPQEKPPNELEIMNGVLAYAGTSGSFVSGQGGMPTCVDLLTDGAGLDYIRRTRDFLEEVEPGADWRSAVSHWESPAFETDGRGPGILDAALKRRIASAALDLLDQPAREVGVQRMLPGAVPASLKPSISPRPNEKGCGGSIYLTAPSVSGDFAFVDLAIACGGLCGVGMILVLERKGLDWKVIALTPTFIA